jgi:hypothetical protein
LELRNQLRERYGLMFNAYTFPPLAKEYCGECGPVMARELLESATPPEPTESLRELLNEQERLL